MIKLREALKLPKDALKELKSTIAKNAKDSPLNAYIIDESSLDLGDFGESSDLDSSDSSKSSANAIPILIKDNINVKGWEITCGSAILKGYKSPYNATAIENLLKNHCVPFGRANMDEFAMGSTTESSVYGATKNPRDLSRTPGGSSGGSAAAVAGGIAVAALGSDTGGSIRQPAGYCGCVGLKPTYGAVSRYGLVAYSSSLDIIGPITQDVRDCALLFDFIKGSDKLDSTSRAEIDSQSATFESLNENRKFKIGILKLKDANSEICKAYDDLVRLLDSQGHEIKEVAMIDLNYHISSYYITSMAEASANLARFDGVRYGNRAQDSANLKELYEKTRTQGFGDEVKRRILIGNFVLSSGYYDAYYLKAQRVRDLIAFQYSEIFKNVDVILSPIAPNVAPKLGEKLSPLEMYLSDIYTIGANLAGIPAICVPIAKNSQNLPIGIQILGNHFAEQNLLDLALFIESKCGRFCE
ncbi:Asp-tRNA(Asn)/Glu-tRNA(Gln) amidotransferase subunit GatA [Helicobacter sp. 23-1045]